MEGRKLSRDWRKVGSWPGKRDGRLPVRKVTRASREAQSRDCAVCSVQCVEFNVKCGVYSVQYTVCRVRCEVCSPVLDRIYPLPCPLFCP